ncbi:hypothetical protein [Embleya sp. NPDC059237]|uniref:hypothetical protein n=1 Tax=Embleya sp. NPDC059237 TaxID=3346784 RepID=UPI0036ABD8D4
MTGVDPVDGRRPSPVTWDGLRDFVDRPPATPPEAGEGERGVEERPAYHSRFAVVRIATIDAISRTVRTLTILGRPKTPARGRV